jgi:hypothetical protein
MGTLELTEILADSLCDRCGLCEMGWCGGAAGVHACDQFQPCGQRPHVSDNDVIFPISEDTAFDLTPEAPPTRDSGRVVDTGDLGADRSPPPDPAAGPVVFIVEYFRSIHRKAV